MRNTTVDELYDSLKELHNEKNHDYAADDNPYSNFEYAALLSENFTDPIDRVFAVIIGIKLARLTQLLGQGKTPKFESMIDTLKDLTNYCGIWTGYYMDHSPKGEARISIDRGLTQEALGRMANDADRKS